MTAVATEELDPITFEVLRHRLAAINDEATFTIMQVSANQIATEANDLNSALMTATGEVVVSGVWILVHSCSIGTLVKTILDEYADNPGIEPGDMFMSNNPYITGRHQLDVVVVAPIFRGDRIVAWSGTIVHQNDVGGPVPGGFAVGARSIYEEAIPMAPVKIVERGRVRKDVENEYVIRSRTPELNRLDLLAQIAANRLHGERVLDLCDRYGQQAFLGTLERLLDGTATRLRRRLASLPDGRWRHTGYLEHDGVADNVYKVALTMTKVGDQLELDFTESSDQGEGLMNAPFGTMRTFAIVALMTMLGFDDVPWVPAAFERIVTFKTREGTVTHARWPAGCSMSGTGAGQEVRTAVNVCIASMLDASEEFEHKVMASGMSSAPGVAISGVDLRGETYSSILVDAQLGGGGGRDFADGTDTSGLLHSPGATTSNIELNEQNYPILYLRRLERPDSGGPGAHRGGVGSEHAWIVRRPAEDVELILFGHGMQQPTSAGVRGGEPGSQNAFLFTRGVDATREVPPPKLITHVKPDDLFVSWCAGGGGVGDPIDRDPEGVLHDADEGLVTVEGAATDYKVVLTEAADGFSVNATATEALRLAARRTRLGGRDPRPIGGEHATGRRLSSHLQLVGGDTIGCRRCGQALCGRDDNVKQHLVVDERPVWDRWALSQEYEGATRFVYRRFFCPGCATQMFVEVNMKDEPFVSSIEVV
jgi:N-methylhydantoinase B